MLREITKNIGLLIGTEACWPAVYEEMMQQMNLRIPTVRGTVRFEVFRCDIEPYDLRYQPRHDLVVDRLTHWFLMARAWLKKISLMDKTYLLNNPFTFQSMEKHSAFCAMIRLGMKIPPTWILPQKEYEDDKVIQTTIRRYNRHFDLDAIAERVGYPLYMKPFDGGGWVGVSRVENTEGLHRAYNKSGKRIMHVQQAVEPSEVFVRALAVGPQVLPMRYAPENPLHERYVIDHDFLSPRHGREMIILAKVINAFFRWEYNSCEALLRGDDLHPIDFANACPDSALTSLHYYFPWVIKALIRWTTFCAATERKMRISLDTDRYFAIGDDPERTYADKLDAYEKIADEYFETERFEEFCATHMPHLDEAMIEFTLTDRFEEILVGAVREKFPEAEHDEFIAHYRGLVDYWRRCEQERISLSRE